LLMIVGRNNVSGGRIIEKSRIVMFS